MSKALIKFLYKAADARDAATFGAGGALAGAGLGAALSNGDNPGGRLLGAGLGAVAGGGLGAVYGNNKDSIDSTASSIFTRNKAGNPLTTGLGFGLAGAAGLAGKDYLTREGVSDTLKNSVNGDEGSSSAEMHKSLREKIPVERRQALLDAVAAKENELTSAILAGTHEVSPIHSNALKLMKLTKPSLASTVARRLAVEHITNSPEMLADLQRSSVGTINDELSNIHDDINFGVHSKVDNVIQGMAGNPGSKPDALKKVLDKLTTSVTDLGKTTHTVPDIHGLRSLLQKSHAGSGAWKRLGTFGLGAGALGMLAAGLENKIRN